MAPCPTNPKQRSTKVNKTKQLKAVEDWTLSQMRKSSARLWALQEVAPHDADARSLYDLASNRLNRLYNFLQTIKAEEY